MAKAKTEKRSPLKDKPLRQAGQSAQEEINRLLDDVYSDHLTFIAITTVMFMTSLIHYFLPVTKGMMVIITGLYLLMACAYAIPKMLKAIRKAKTYKLGRDGEKIVSENLEPLKRDGAYVLHDLVGGSFNIDHAVVSPRGVFIIETKTRSKREGNPKVSYDGKTLLIDGMKPLDDPLTQARANAKWLKDLLKESTGKDFPVKPIVAFPGWWIESNISSRKCDVWVLEPKAIPKFVPHEPVKLSDSDVNLANFHLQRFIRAS